MKTTALLTAALIALGEAPALAQPGGGDPGQWAQMREQRRAEMAADVRIILHIRPDQEAAYQSFMAALHPAGGEGGAGPADHEAAYQAFSAVLSPDQQQVLAALRRLALDRPHWGGRRHGGNGGREDAPQ